MLDIDIFTLTISASALSWSPSDPFIGAEPFVIIEAGTDHKLVVEIGGEQRNDVGRILILNTQSDIVARPMFVRDTTTDEMLQVPVPNGWVQFPGRDR